MMDFSLLYISKEQEENAKKHAANQVCYKIKPQKESEFVLVGNKMKLVAKDATREYEIPCYFHDLNIYKVIEHMFGREVPKEIQDMFYEIPFDKSVINYRQEIFKDFENKNVFESFYCFQSDLARVRKLLANRQQIKQSIYKDKYTIEAILEYYRALENLIAKIEYMVNSTGLSAFLKILKSYMNSTEVVETYNQAKLLNTQIENIKGIFCISNNKIHISFAAKDDDYSKDLSSLLGIQSREKRNFSLFQELIPNSLEIKILEFIVQENRELFNKCHVFANEHPEIIDSFIHNIDRELKFYLSGTTLINTLKNKGFFFSYPMISDEKNIELAGICDIVLALKSSNSKDVVLNDFILENKENGAWVTGANQGGKTTFVRSIGQTIYFAMLGFPVLSKSIKIKPFKAIYTHFSSEENASILNGKLQEELNHLQKLIDSPRESSFFILNELFSSTAVLDAYEMGCLLINKLIEEKHKVVCVTHVPKLAGARTDMVSLVAKTSTHERTFIIAKGEAKIEARARDIANKYRLTSEDIKEWIINGI